MQELKSLMTFLDHAKTYLKADRKNEAGVVAGVVFEDSLRRVCRKHEIAERGRPLDDLISELAKKDILSATKAKRARVAAHVRTKATHAQWDEFEQTLRQRSNSRLSSLRPIWTNSRNVSPNKSLERSRDG